MDSYHIPAGTKRVVLDASPVAGKSVKIAGLDEDNAAFLAMVLERGERYRAMLQAKQAQADKMKRLALRERELNLFSEAIE